MKNNFKLKALIRFVFLVSAMLTAFICLANNVTHKKLIGITKIVDHTSLLLTQKGIIQALSDEGYVEGQHFSIINETAQGNIALSSQIAQKLVSLDPDLIIAISTPSAQTTIAKAKNKVPVLFSSVTDPVFAGLAKDLKEKNDHISGVMDFPPIKECMRLIKTLVPNIKTLGVIYNASESNSIKIVSLLKEQADRDGITILEATANDSANVAESVRSLVGKVDAIYLPPDNTVVSSIKSLVKTALEGKMPVFTTDPDLVSEGVLAAIGHSHYDVGYKTGKMAAMILSGKKSMSDLSISSADKLTIAINKKSLDKLGVKLPDTLSTKNITMVGE